MKKLASLLKFTLVLFLLTTLTSCILLSPDDPCYNTKKPEIEVGIKATVHVLDKDDNPIADQELKITLYKESCGIDDTKGHVYFSGPTNEQGIRQTTVAYYKLRNTVDKVWVDVYAVNLGNGSAYEDSEYASYSYDDFIPGITKEVHVYIYRNF